MLGYRYKNDILTIDPQEAEVVRSIFTDFLSGMGKVQIMKNLNAAGIVTRFGNAWGKSSVDKVLRNVAYTGNLLLQTTYISDHMTKQTRKNNGELPMYHVEGSHEQIISKATFDAAQAEIARRAAKYHPKSKTPATYPFSGIMTCGICGKHFRRKITATGAVWICETFNRIGKAACASKQIPENTLMALTANVLGLSQFDWSVFKEHIMAMRISEANKVVYTFFDGHEVDAIWQDRSRSESWTEEKKQQARNLTLRQRRGMQ
jgi:hypothetical protein